MTLGADPPNVLFWLLPNQRREKEALSTKSGSHNNKIT